MGTPEFKDGDDSIQTSAARPSRSVPVRAISLAVVAGMLVYLWMATLANRASLVATVSALPALLWLQLAGLSLLSYLIRFARWRYYLASLGHRIPGATHLSIYLSAFALTLTPGKAGETVRSVYLAPFGVPYPHSIAAFIAERLLDVLAVGALASLAVLAFPAQGPWLAAALLCCGAAVVLLRSRLLSIAVTRLAKGRLGAHAAAAMSTIALLLAGRTLVLGAALSMLAWTVQGLSLYLVVDALGYHLPVWTIIAIYSLSILAGAASFLPGGLGATEAAIALLLGTLGVTPGDAIAASLISRGMTLWLAVALGLCCMTGLALGRSTRPQPAAP